MDNALAVARKHFRQDNSLNIKFFWQIDQAFQQKDAFGARTAPSEAR